MRFLKANAIRFLSLGGAFLIGMLMSGCAGWGFYRTAEITALPDMEVLAKHLQKNPKITVLKFHTEWLSGGFGLFPHFGRRAPIDTYEFSYSNSEAKEPIRGELLFSVDFADQKKTYRISLRSRSRLSNELMESSWQFAKEIERDLIEVFGMTEIKGNVAVYCSQFVPSDKDPDSNRKPPAKQPTSEEAK
jgi:hypothetical protein